MKITFEEFNIQTQKNNLAEFDQRLSGLIGEHDFFSLHDITDLLAKKIATSGIMNGHLIVQVMHTTCILSVNELDEPMLLGDICRHMEKNVPRVVDYLHNSMMRTANLCEEDDKCNRNADAHIKSFLIGNHSVTLLIRDGALILGQWQRVAMIDFDGPRDRRLAVQICGS